MSDYSYLTDEDKAQIVADVVAARPNPEALLLDRERAHFRSVIEAKLGLHEVPDPYEPIDVTKEAADQTVLEAEAVKLPAPRTKLAEEMKE